MWHKQVSFPSLNVLNFTEKVNLQQCLQIVAYLVNNFDYFIYVILGICKVVFSGIWTSVVSQNFNTDEKIGSETKPISKVTSTQECYPARGVPRWIFCNI